MYEWRIRERESEIRGLRNRLLRWRCARDRLPPEASKTPSPAMTPADTVFMATELPVLYSPLNNFSRQTLLTIFTKTSTAVWGVRNSRAHCRPASSTHSWQFRQAARATATPLGLRLAAWIARRAPDVLFDMTTLLMFRLRQVPDAIRPSDEIAEMAKQARKVWLYSKRHEWYWRSLTSPRHTSTLRSPDGSNRRTPTCKIALCMSQLGG